MLFAIRQQKKMLEIYGSIVWMWGIRQIWKSVWKLLPMKNTKVQVKFVDKYQL